jgi:hypothetical protein
VLSYFVVVLVNASTYVQLAAVWCHMAAVRGFNSEIPKSVHQFRVALDLKSFPSSLNPFPYSFDAERLPLF